MLRYIHKLVLYTTIMHYCCIDVGTCKEGSIRLASGVIDQEGRVEVCVNGVWGALCDDGWDSTDAHVICKQLGYAELGNYITHTTLH